MIGQLVVFATTPIVKLGESQVWIEGEVVSLKMREVSLSDPTKPAEDGLNKHMVFRYFYLIKADGKYYERMEDEVYKLHERAERKAESDENEKLV